jgi:glucans biosynthesis protein
MRAALWAAGLSPLGAGGRLWAAGEGADGPDAAFGPARPFGFDALTDRARRLAAAPYRPPVARAADTLARIDYDVHWRIRFRDDVSLTPAGPDAPVQMFHPGRYFQQPVGIHLVENGRSREVLFDRDYFTMPADSPARKLPDDIGFAGFRVMRPGMQADWISFLGASYFRTDGPQAQYGLSARGIAIDTGLARPEEFPRFTDFWLGAPEDLAENPAENPAEDLTVWALLDGPSIAGAYRFGLRRGKSGGDHKLTVATRLFMRNRVERLGIAPLTSMYWYSERDRPEGQDWRPEIHDSDGLALATGAGERIWRPLTNPARLTTTRYLDQNPRGFGLSQRDRDFDHYQDDGVFYDKRPSAWIEPLGDWGRGAVELVEIPTADETFDNIVAYWVAEAPALAGAALSYDYAITWTGRDPIPETVASVVALRRGRGGHPGQTPRPKSTKMVIDFEGPALAGLDVDSGIEPVIDAPDARILDPVAVRPVVGTDRWRLSFDVETTGQDMVELRAYLRLADRALTETLLLRSPVTAPVPN